MNYKKLNIDRIKIDAEKIGFSEGDSYLQSYPYFIKYFENINGEIEKHHLVISSHFVYGWMPKIIRLDLSNIDEILKILNLVTYGKLVNDSELLLLKSCINNSLVGVSKLLHFINPRKYAIWDSNIFKYLTGEKPHAYKIGDPNKFLMYIDDLNHFTQTQEFKNIHNTINRNFEYEISIMRSIELIMFETERNKS